MDLKLSESRMARLSPGEVVIFEGNSDQRIRGRFLRMETAGQDIAMIVRVRHWWRLWRARDYRVPVENNWRQR